jgi:hypothetical protein
MDEVDNDGAQEPHQDVQNGGKDEFFNFISHEDYHPILIGEWNLPRVSLGIRIVILISIGEKIILDSHWFMKVEGAIDWREGFPTSIGQGEQSQGGVLEAYQGKEEYLVFCGRKRRRRKGWKRD